MNQLSDRIEQTVSSVEEVRTDASAAKTTADNAQKAANDAAAAASTAHTTATAAQTAANKAQEHATSAANAASTAKANADAAQAAANKANASLADAKKNLETLQNRADVTDEELTAAKNAVASAQTAADSANSAASKAKELANTAQSTADTAKANAATAQTKANAAASAASTAQSTADTAKANAKKAQDDVDALKNRVTTAETSIKQNSEAIALRATKTEVTSAVNGINIGGRNLVLGSNTGKNWNYGTFNKDDREFTKENSETSENYIFSSYFDLEDGKQYTLSFDIKQNGHMSTSEIFILPSSYTTTGVIYSSGTFGVSTTYQHKVFVIGPEYHATSFKNCQIRFDNNGSKTPGTKAILYIKNVKLELGNKPTDWSPAPEDLQADAINKANTALSESKKYTDAQLKITSEGITSTVSKTYATKTDLSTTNSNVTRAQETADSATTVAANAQKTANDVKTDLATNYTTTTDMESKISQSAEGITSTVSKTYATKSELSTTNSNVSKAQTAATAAGTAASAAQSTANTAKANAKTAQDTADSVKADLKANYTTTTDMESKISQSAEGITSTVSKTYATKSELSTTNSNVSKAQSTADSGVSKANAAQSTANTVKNDLSNLKIGGRNIIPGTGTGEGWGYETFNKDNREFTKGTTGTHETFIMSPESFDLEKGKQYALSFDAKQNGYVSSAEVFILPRTYATTGIALNGAGFSISTTYEHKLIVFTPPSSVTSLENCFIRFDNNGSKTSGTKAILYIKNIKLEVGNKPTDWSPAPEDYSTTTEMQSKIKQTADSITSAVSKTYQTKTDMQKYPTINQTSVRYTFSGSQPANSGKWIKLGTWTSTGDSQCCSIQVFTGNGFNGLANQNSDFSIFIKDGYQGTPSTSSAFGVTVTLGLNCTDVQVQVRAKSSTVCDVWFYCPWKYGTGSYAVDRGYGTWEHSGLSQVTTPTDGMSQSISMADYLTSEETRSAITQTAESIKSTVAATYVNNETLSSYATKSQLEQTSTSLTSRIQTTEKSVSGMSTTVKNVNDYMTFARENNQPTLTIGSSSSSFRTKLTNTGEKFMQGDQTIMELDGITSTVKASRVQMGHYQWRDTGTSMQLVYIP